MTPLWTCNKKHKGERQDKPKNTNAGSVPNLKTCLPKCPHNSSCDMTFPSTQQLSQAKIRNFCIEVIVNQYIAWFNVPVNHFRLNSLMQIGKTASSISRQNKTRELKKGCKLIDLRLSCAKKNLHTGLPSKISMMTHSSMKPLF